MSTLLNSLHLPSKSKPSSPIASYVSPEVSPSPVVDSSVVRALVFNGKLSLQVTLAEDELPPSTDLPINCCYVGARQHCGSSSLTPSSAQLEASRISYLPLLLAQVRENLLDLILGKEALQTLSDDSLWFSFNGSPLRW